MTCKINKIPHLSSHSFICVLTLKSIVKINGIPSFLIHIEHICDCHMKIWFQSIRIIILEIRRYYNKQINYK